jgi:hypothetical protein
MRRVPVIRTLCEIPALGIAFEARFKVELWAGSGRHFAVIGSFQKDAVDRRWPAWDLISLYLDDFSLGWRKVFSSLKRKPFISAIDV